MDSGKQTFEAESLDALTARVGEELAVSDWLPITQERINRFAEVTGDLQWIHIDAERARRESPYGTTIAHGYLTLSLLPGLSQGCITVHGTRMAVNYGLNRVRFMAPVRVDDRIRARFTLQSVEALPDGGAQVIWQALVEVEGSSKPACVAEMVARRYT
ncbi:MAG: dehydratase [Comamonadaceae bacterium]|nr:dehydratase [Comamonadaceae bacterium]